ncbi:MAG TPA: hypothetical protein VN976_04100 [Verrucomicrobiae bacterium]|nr:hypothetical protein [Verrucomicrobiae bacterium]
MRPRLSHWCRDVLGNAGLLRAAAILFLAIGFWQPCGAQQASPEARLGTWTPLSIEQVRDTASLTLPRSESGVDAKLVKVTRRPDLEYLLSTIVQRRGSQGLFLYQVEIPSQASYDGQWTWIVAVAARRQEAYELYSFESMERRANVAAEFNRFASELALTLSKSELANFAAFFLETTVPFRPGEIVLDQDTLRDSVGRHYFTAYDEAWRSIDAYSRWWHGFLDAETASELAPRTEIEPDGRYRVTLSRVVTTDGAHPQVQQWQMEISPAGNVQATSMRTIFPKAPRWMFYDSPQQAKVAPVLP